MKNGDQVTFADNYNLCKELNNYWESIWKSPEGKGSFTSVAEIFTRNTGIEIRPETDGTWFMYVIGDKDKLFQWRLNQK